MAGRRESPRQHTVPRQNFPLRKRKIRCSAFIVVSLVLNVLKVRKVAIEKLAGLSSATSATWPSEDNYENIENAPPVRNVLRASPHR
jgi:hypothetical protein